MQHNGTQQRDFADSIKAPAERRKRAFPRPNRMMVRTLLGSMACVGLIWSLFGSGDNVVASTAATHEEWIGVEIARPATTDSTWRHETIREGDAAIYVLSRLGFPFAEVSRMIDAARPVYPLRQIVAGRDFDRHDQGEHTDVYYPVDSSHVLRLSLRADTWNAALESRAGTSRQVVFQGEIRESLFVAAARAGMDDRATMNLVDIFAWDIDFARDLRSGDRFRVLLQERFDRQGKLFDSVIQAAEFVNQGHAFRAVRYAFPNGRVEYFTPRGKSMRKTYLKAPVKFTRISSRFSLGRMHPILGYTRAHRGVDYAAPTGTPIHAVGDGRVVYAGWKGGYGRFVLIRHTNSNHATAYGHMRRYGHGIKRGARVRQGQVIGYVGMSGLATGPHLHFEFRVRGRAVNPLYVKRTPAKPVPSTHMAYFRQLAEKVLNRMTQTPTLLAWG
ncbi:MAG: M23 family metallopeptidase [Mariprofundaceae bacterium]|nr:M23 family metallopeptidase [Mariprofundaceae bacterium]